MDEPRSTSFSLVLVVALFTFMAGTIGGAAAGVMAARRVVDTRPAPVVVGAAIPREQASVTPTATVSVEPEDPKVVGEAQGSIPTPTPAIQIAAPPDGPMTGPIADVVDHVNHAVVSVVNKQSFEGFFNSGANLQPVGMGTGFIISQDGLIVTNDHVVSGSQALDVIFDDGTKVEAQLVGTDPFTDLAVVKVDVPVPAAVALGDSTVLRPGETVIAIGSALGNYTNTVTEGVVSGLARRLELSDGFSAENLIQHDAPINPGNSGGPLFNMRGEVVGVNTYGIHQAGDGRYADGLGFAVASETVQKIVTVLIAEGKVTRPYMGISYIPLTPLTAESEGLTIENGVLVTQVPSGGPARDVGIQEGDVITKLNGLQIDRSNPFVNLLFQFKPGDTIDVELFRPTTNETIILQVTLEERQD